MKKYNYDYVPWNLHTRTKERLKRMKARIEGIVGMKLSQDELIVEILKHEKLVIEAVKDRESHLDSEDYPLSDKLKEVEEIGIVLQERFKEKD